MTPEVKRLIEAAGRFIDEQRGAKADEGSIAERRYDEAREGLEEAIAEVLRQESGR